MLGGSSPLLIFTFPEALPLTVAKGIPLVSELLGSNPGIPIPIYLDEKLTAVYVDDESKSLVIDTTSEVKHDEKSHRKITYQRAVQNDVTVNLLAKRTSPLLSVLLAINDIIFKKVVAGTYNIAYINGPTVILQGLLEGFSTNNGANDDLVRISLHLSKAKDQIPLNGLPTGLPELPAFTGSVPVGGTGL